MLMIIKWSWLWSAFLFFSLQGQEYPEYTTDSGLRYSVIRSGTGEQPKPYHRVKVNYRGYLLDGTEFGAKNDYSINLSSAIAGWQEGLGLMKVGAQYRFIVPANLGYGEEGRLPKIPPNSVLVYDIELLASESPKELNRVMAKVDKEIITWVDLYKRGGSLDDLIQTKLITNALKKSGQSISEQEIEASVEAHVQNKYAGDRMKFVDFLTAEGISFERFSESIEERLALAKLVKKNYFKTAPPNGKSTSQERQAAYQKIVDGYSRNQTITLSVLAIDRDLYAKQTSPKESEAATRKEIQQIHSKLKKLGTPRIVNTSGSKIIDPQDTELIDLFHELGGKRVKTADGVQIKPSALTAEVGRVVSQLEPGQISEVFEDGLSLKILLLTSQTVPQPPSSKELSSRIEQVVMDKKWQSYYDSLMRQLRNEATIVIYE